MTILLIYIAIFTASFFIVTKSVHRATRDYTSLKTVTFGDESAVRPNRIAGVISILTIFVLWGAFTGSKLLPEFLHAPGPFQGETSFTYVSQADGKRDDATVTLLVHPRNETAEPPVVCMAVG